MSRSIFVVWRCKYILLRDRMQNWRLVALYRIFLFFKRLWSNCFMRLSVNNCMVNILIEERENWKYIFIWSRRTPVKAWPLVAACNNIVEFRDTCLQQICVFCRPIKTSAMRKASQRERRSIDRNGVGTHVKFSRFSVKRGVIVTVDRVRKRGKREKKGYDRAVKQLATAFVVQERPSDRNSWRKKN